MTWGKTLYLPGTFPDYSLHHIYSQLFTVAQPCDVENHGTAWVGPRAFWRSGSKGSFVQWSYIHFSISPWLSRVLLTSCNDLWSASTLHMMLRHRLDSLSVPVPQQHQQIKETPVINYRAAKRIITGCQDYNPPLKDYNALYYCTSFEILVGR